MRPAPFSPRWHDAKWQAVRALAELLAPYRNHYSYRHRFISWLYRRLLKQTECLDPSQLRALQLIRLKRIARIAERVPWWRERFASAGFGSRTLSGPEDIARLPVASKYSFIDVPRESLIARRLHGRRIQIRRTSGTSGVPSEWWFDKNLIFVETSAYFFRTVDWQRLPLRRSGRRPIVATFFVASYGVPEIMLDMAGVGNELDRTIRRSAQMIERNALPILFGYPTNLLLFARKLAQLRCRVRIRLAVTAGQHLDDESHRFIMRHLDCPIVRIYGAREFGCGGIECPARPHRYHVNAESVLLEITDDQGNRVLDGEEGWITVTSLANGFMPLLRYRMDDRGTLIPGPCPCGRTLPVLEVSGKQMDFIKLRSGDIVPFRHVNLAIFSGFSEEIEFYQVVQPSLDRIVLHLQLRHEDTEGFEARILPEMRRYIGDDLQIAFEYHRKWSVDSRKKAKIFIPLAQADLGETVEDSQAWQA